MLEKLAKREMRAPLAPFNMRAAARYDMPITIAGGHNKYK
jgi:hypothetical protein